MSNSLMIAAAGAGKTTYLVKKALSSTGNVLITTYTDANEEEIRKKFIKLNKTIPSNVTIQTWFSFLLQHGVKPYQGCLTEKEITGLLLVNQQSGVYIKNGKTIYFSEEKHFERFYFTPTMKIFSEKLSKFVFRTNEKSDGKVIDRISRIFANIFIDEVQDLAGYDLDIIKLLFQTQSHILLVGDPRQVTYLTHHEKKNSSYKDGKIEQFVLNECKKLNCIIDKVTLKNSHRNNAEICKFSSLLYPDEAVSEPCNCNDCREEFSNHNGVFLVLPKHIEEYKGKYSPAILRYNEASGDEWNLGKSKGLGFPRVLIHPTDTFIRFLKNGQLTKSVNGKTKRTFDVPKYYVGLTRAKFSVGIVCDYKDNDTFIEGVQRYAPEC
ncbi:MAG: UvrD-helicase domain-containing protein [Bacteroidota bacterium]